MNTMVSFRKLTALDWIKSVNLLFLMSKIYSFMRLFLICFSEASSRSPKGPSISVTLLSLAIKTSSDLRLLLDSVS